MFVQSQLRNTLLTCSFESHCTIILPLRPWGAQTKTLYTHFSARSGLRPPPRSMLIRNAVSLHFGKCVRQCVCVSSLVTFYNIWPLPVTDVLACLYQYAGRWNSTDNIERGRCVLYCVIFSLRESSKRLAAALSNGSQVSVNFKIVTFEVLKAVLVRVQIFCDVTLFRWVSSFETSVSGYQTTRRRIPQDTNPQL